MTYVSTRDLSVGSETLFDPDLQDAWLDEDFIDFDQAAQEALGDLLMHWSALTGRLLVCPAVWHPNGFAVFVIGKYQDFSVRLHVWIPGAPGVLEWHPPVHSHDRHVSSVVLFGQKNDLLWRPQHSEGANELLNVVRRAYNIEHLVPSRQMVELSLQERFVYSTDHYFSQPAGIYHEIPPAQHHAFATLCIKSNVVLGRRQAIVGKLGQAPRLVKRRRVTMRERKELLRLLSNSVAWKR